MMEHKKDYFLFIHTYIFKFLSIDNEIVNH